MVASSDQVSYVTYYTWMAECVSQPARYVDHDRCINPEPAPQTRHQRQTFETNYWPDLSGKSNSNGNLQGRASRQQSFSCRFDFPNRLRTVAAPSRCPCMLVEAPEAHIRVAPGAAYAYAKIPLREGPVGPYSDGYSVAPGPERLKSRFMQRAQAHFRESCSFLKVCLHNLPLMMQRAVKETMPDDLSTRSMAETVIKSRHSAAPAKSQLLSSL